MKKGEELGVTPVAHLLNKEGTNELQELTRKLNDILYQYRYRYISTRAANTIQKKLATICTKIKDLNVPPKAKAKKDEILERARGIYRNLTTYIKEYSPSPEDKDQAQKTINFLVMQLIQAKKENKLYDEVMKWMRVSGEIYSDYACLYKNEVRIDKLKGFLEELDTIYDSRMRPWSGL